jgi:hypothetical protein
MRGVTPVFFMLIVLMGCHDSASWFTQLNLWRPHSASLFNIDHSRPDIGGSVPGHLMKIATFNINNVNKLPNLVHWLRTSAPDVVCLQELKSTDADFPIAAVGRAGYDAVWCGQKTWNGVAILARDMKPVLTRLSGRNSKRSGAEGARRNRVYLGHMPARNFLSTPALQ